MSVTYLESVRRVEEITGHKIPFYKVDLNDYEALKNVFAQVSVCLYRSLFEYQLHAM